MVSVPQIMFTASLTQFLSGRRFVRRKLLRKSAQEINAAFLQWLGRRQDTRSYFVFLNYLDSHDPYQRPRHSTDAIPRPGPTSSSRA